MQSKRYTHNNKFVKVNTYFMILLFFYRKKKIYTKHLEFIYFNYFFN